MIKGFRFVGFSRERQFVVYFSLSGVLCTKVSLVFSAQMQSLMLEKQQVLDLKEWLDLVAKFGDSGTSE